MLVHVVIRLKSLFLYPGEITTALFRRHGLADLEKVVQHHLLAFRAQPSRIRQGVVDLRRRIRRAGEQFLEFGVVRVDVLAHLAAPGQISGVEIGNAFEINVAQVEFLLQPGQFGFIASPQIPRGGSAGKVNAAISCRRHGQPKHENEQASLHGVIGAELDRGRALGRSAGQVRREGVRPPVVPAPNQRSHQ